MRPLGRTVASFPRDQSSARCGTDPEEHDEGADKSLVVRQHIDQATIETLSLYKLPEVATFFTRVAGWNCRRTSERCGERTH